MNSNLRRPLLVLAVAFVAALTPLEAKAMHCSTAETAGNWAYTYTGTIFTQSGALPGASVGRYHQDAEGNIVGSQVRSVAGDAAAEDIAGTLTVYEDCTGSATVNVYVNGQLQRTAVIALVFDKNLNHARYIFQSLKLPDGTNVPVVITIDGNRVTTQH